MTGTPAPPVRAGRAHAALLAAIHAASVPAAEAWDTDAFARLLALPTTLGLLAGAEGFILGRIAADEAEVLTLAVHPDARRAGQGRALLAALAAAAAARGAHRLVLEVATGNAAALALYRGAGLAPVGRRRAYYADGADALILAAPLAGAAAAPTSRPPPR